VVGRSRSARITWIAETEWCLEDDGRVERSGASAAPAEDILKRYRAELWPRVDPYLGPFLGALVFLLVAVLAKAPWIRPVRHAALYVLRKPAGFWALLGLTVAVHAVEAVVACRTARDLGCERSQVLGWVSLTLLLGVGALKPLLGLQALAAAAD